MMTNEEIIKKVTELLEAKEAVLFCLNTPNGCANMHGLAFWAHDVERLRKELHELL